ncbi:TenA family protein [Psychromonas sp. 14N.309.X.WAT.B.A12]|uniref:TenA family protein n=1 Tax=unclassified Psychromonas TaxID=2614957 RepID=UPI0025AF29CC|nr:TenA family protein [Psychromonas sp. 14N.309.X.WAT.B.A12]MDN2664950.1 TenA family protein [Psychromonas sp. 14N.309.X.WAT.B.A12]
MRPSEQLKQSCIENWSAATAHPFCIELADGSLPLEKMRVYLAQDYTFIDNFVRLAASAIHHAPALPDRLPLAHFLGIIAGPENTYFQRSFDMLEVAQSERVSPLLLQPTNDFQALMLKAANSGEYGNMVAVLCVAEWVYLSWAEPVVAAVESLPFYFGEWITLHAGEYFESVVEHLRSQLDTAYNKADASQQETIKEYFQQAVLLEKQFFDACYE